MIANMRAMMLTAYNKLELTDAPEPLAGRDLLDNVIVLRNFLLNLSVRLMRASILPW